MVGIMATVSRDKISSLINSVKFDANIPSKLEHLRSLSDELSNADSVLLSKFLSPLLDLLSDRFSPVRKFTAEMIGDIGLKFAESIPEIVPVLIPVLKDDTPAVARQAIRCGMEIFRYVLFKVALQGMYSNELDTSLESSWSWMLKFRDEICSLAFKPGSDGRRLLALKFMETVVLLYTPDPNGSSDPPADLDSEGTLASVKEFNISWLRGGHPILNIGDLSVEASQSLGLLLDQLRFPTVKSLNNLIIIMLINSLSAIASKRPAFYGRILPVLLGLDPSSSSGKGVHHALKSAFLSCLNCTHPGAVPWRDRLIDALRELKAVGVAEHAAIELASQNSGSLERKNDSLITQDRKPTSKALDDIRNDASRKRTGMEESTDLLEDKMSVKRMKSVPVTSDGSTNDLSSDQGRVPSGGSGACKMEEDSGPVQQLVGMFGALVAQGEKAIASLEILISSISADLLAEVVIANMRNFPSNRPQIEGDNEQLFGRGSCPGMSGSNSEFDNLTLLLTNLLSQSSAVSQKDGGMDSLPSAANELELRGTSGNTDVPGMSYVMEEASVPTTTPASSGGHVPCDTENGGSGTPSDVIDVGNEESDIPGLDLPVPNDELVITSLGSTELKDASQEQVSSLARSSLELLPSVSTDRSEELSPRATVTDLSCVNSLSATSSGLSTQLLLPKISAPVISLSDDQLDNLQKPILLRITDTYKQIATAGGSQVCLSVLAYLGVKFPLDLEPWKLLQTHILSDYVNHEGHELTLRVLYRLYGEAEEDHDFVSSTTAKSVYEMFLLTVAETLRDSFPWPDKCLNRLLVEVPYLPDSILKLLEGMCSPGGSNKDNNNPERVRQGLSIVWSLILLRPPIRDACLTIALKSAIHPVEEVRDKALRLVVNKLYPQPSMSRQIEAFAWEVLVSAANANTALESCDADGANAEFKDSDMGKPSNELPVVGTSSKGLSAVTDSFSISESISSSLLAEGQRRMALYFAICTKNHSLFRQIFVIYESTSKAVKQAVLHHIPKLVRAIGPSPELLQILPDPPTGSMELVMQVLHTLIDGTTPSSELLSTIKKLYDTKVKDVEILILILPFLPKDEVLAMFPHLVNSPLEKFQLALARVLQGSSSFCPAITPAEALIAIHGIDPERDGIPLKKVTEACNTCFEQRQIFTQQVLAKVLNQLVEQTPLPLLFMRTVLQAIGAFPSLVDYIMEILSRLVQKQIWKYPKLWVGFIKCAFLTKPESFGVLLQLPPAHLENVLHRTPALRDPLIAHASQPHIKSSLPRSVLVVLGLASDFHNSDLTKPTHSETGELGKSEHTHSSHAQSEETSKSDKEVVTDKSKESSDAT
ncbi:uncharacterized protein [Coffea arabica]|uniref:Uncharacterized protein isoform X1 n=2 Tax=Coffea arabica TaxID=13443 RepID=A0A6P6SJE9_COFAR